MMISQDAGTSEHLWQCPECGETIRLSGMAAVCLAQRAGRCQGCRAGAAFKRSPGLAGLFLDFWARADAWPQSDAWMDALPACVAPMPGSGQSQA